MPATNRHSRSAAAMAGARHSTSSTRRCNVDGCSSAAVHDSDGSRRPSMYCQEHTCQNPRTATQAFCINSRNPAHRYCSFHGKCRAPQCTNVAQRSEKQPWPYLCPHHRCISCTLPRFGQFRVCQAHMNCQHPGCRNPPDFKHPRLLCHNHSCTIAPNCPHTAIGAVRTASYCQHHRPCEVVRGCDRLRVRLPNGHQANHCDQHVPCARAGHGCRLFALPGSPLCPNHKCNLQRCPRDKAPGSHFCQAHTCAHQACRQSVADIDNGRARFCATHECAARGCCEAALTTGGYCGNHSCTHGTCNAQRMGNTGYCDQHLCRAPGCNHEAAHKNAYCRDHGCEEKGCTKARVGGPKQIRKCLDHHVEYAEKRAKSRVEYDAEFREAILEEELREYRRMEHERQVKEQEEDDRRRAEERRIEDQRRIMAEAERLRRADEARRQTEQRRAEEVAEQIRRAEEAKRREDKRRVEEEVNARLAERERQRHEAQRLRDEEDRRQAKRQREREADAQMAEELRRKREREADAQMAEELRRKREAADRLRRQIEDELLAEQRRREEEAAAEEAERRLRARLHNLNMGNTGAHHTHPHPHHHQSSRPDAWGPYSDAGQW